MLGIISDQQLTAFLVLQQSTGQNTEYMLLLLVSKSTTYSQAVYLSQEGRNFICSWFFRITVSSPWAYFAKHVNIQIQTVLKTSYLNAAAHISFNLRFQKVVDEMFTLPVLFSISLLTSLCLTKTPLRTSTV